MKMINIRLNPDDERRAEALQKSGVTVSEVVRRAIREEYERRVGTPRPADWAAKLVADVIRRHPTKTRAAVASTDVEGAKDVHPGETLEEAPLILVDTGPLVALCDPQDSRHEESVAELQALSRGTFALCEPVMTEAWFLLRAAPLRRRLDALVTDVPFFAWVPGKPDAFRREVLDWLERYSDQEPDWADGYLVVACAHTRNGKIWTYDSEFTRKWRRTDGSRVPLAT